MEAASRPTLQPLTDLPVEEPMGLPETVGSENRTLSSGGPAQATAVRADELLAHGVLLGGAQELSAAPAEDISVSAIVRELAPAAGETSPPARPDSALVPTLSAPADPGTARALAFAPAPAAKPPAPKESAASSPAPSSIPALKPQGVLRTPAATVPAPVVTTASGGKPSGIAAAAGSAAPSMDRDFIARNQIVERYLSGRLPLKGATEFERFCRDHPRLLDELGLAERVHAGLRLLEASGKPEPWQEAPRSFWSKPQLVIGLAGGAVLLAIILAIVASDSRSKTQRIERLQKQLVEQPLDAATSTRTIRLVPSRDGASNTPVVVIGGGAAQLVDFKIDESRSGYKTFRITIDRLDQGRVGVIHNLVKDSNGHLRIALNSSALGPGNYQLTIEGLSWRGDPEPDSWITIGIQR